MPEIEIRPATAADFQHLLEIDHNGKSEYVWQMDRMIEESQITIRFREIRLPRTIKIDYPFSKDMMLERWKGGAAVLAATLAGIVVGYIAVDEHGVHRTAWVRDLAIAERHRRQGIASALILATQDWAAKRGLRRMVIEMHSKNDPAIRLALKLGYEFSGYNDQYYSNQDIALFFCRLLR